MILEAIVTTLDRHGALNVAPMGPQIEPGARSFLLRPYQSSTTFRNLKERGEGVLHVTDDVLLFARGAIGEVGPVATRAAEHVHGRVLLDACRYAEFRVLSLDDREDRAAISAEIVAEGRFRDFFGFNRARHAVIEAAILATRTAFLPIDAILAEYRKLAIIVEKTGGEAERAAFGLLEDHVRRDQASHTPAPS